MRDELLVREILWNFVVEGKLTPGGRNIDEQPGWPYFTKLVRKI